MIYEKSVITVPGNDQGKIFMFTLSTCIWCKKTKALLKELNLEYSFVDIDLVLDNTKEELLHDFAKYNPEQSFPTIVIDDGKEIMVGFDEEKLRGLAKNGK